MLTVILTCAFGALCTMILWVVGAAAVERDMMLRHTGRLFPPEEF
ncbi:MAG TPA: hypothetical protein VL976_12460 [Xanthobacteraceae bacterium]|jgi:hypothetical protein|nr:hypothetical protein [Xanthobacteraceae bacterium]